MNVPGTEPNPSSFLPAQAPFLLLPVRLETRFMQAAETQAPELWVRLYPDQIHVNRFDPALDPKEVEQGNTYWTEVGKLKPGDDPVGPWRVLVAAHGPQRAAYIRLQTWPRSVPGGPHATLPPRPSPVKTGDAN